MKKPKKGLQTLCLSDSLIHIMKFIILVSFINVLSTRASENPNQI